MTPLERLVRWTVDPRYREELLGDLAELRERRRRRTGGRSATIRYLRDVASACLLMARPRRDLRGSALTVAVTALLIGVLAIRARGAAEHPGRYTVTATDPAGVFTVQIDGTRVVGATIDGAPVPEGAIRQRDLRVVIADGQGDQAFELSVKPRGGIQWSPRAARGGAR